jgi:hypothetical protein
MTSSTAIMQAGAAALAQAAVLSDQARYWILGKAYRESCLGASGVPAGCSQFDGTNNWGAVYWPNAVSPPNRFTTSWKTGNDSYYGKPVTTMIAVYPTQVDGAKGLLSVYEKYGDILPVLADPKATVYDFAKALYKHGYFMGCHVGRDGAPSLNRGQSFAKRAEQLGAALANDPNATVKCVGTRKIANILMDTQVEADDANIREYANMINGGANVARAALHAPPEPLRRPIFSEPESSGWWWKLPALAYGAYQIAKWRRKK